MLSVAEAQAAIQSHLGLLPTVTLGLRELHGSVLAEPIVMERDQPPFDRVTMDGIALDSRSGGTHRFRIAGTQAAGAAPLTLQHGADCIEVMTGAQLPVGCDCVVPVERIRVQDGFAELDNVELAPWLNVHRRGSDATVGNILLQPGAALDAVTTAIIASAGYARVSVRTSPRIALISTGDELVEPGQPIQPWQVRRSNTYALQAALQRHGHSRVVDAHIADDMQTLRKRLGALLADNDVLILSGGVSMGRFDFVPQVLTELGVDCVFHKIEQRPGKPMWFGVAGGKAVFALPGNPVSTLICLHRYVLPALRQMQGMPAPATACIALASDARGHAELTVFMPVQLPCDAAGISRALPCPTRGSGDFISLLGTDGFVELPPTEGMMVAGTVVPLYRW